jgi:hypothetical protein
MNRTHAMLFLMLSGSAMAAEPPRLPERPAEYTPLENFVGRWTTAGREKEFLETCDWYHGKFHVVCNSVSRRADGSMGYGMSILSYVPGVGYAYSGIGSKGRYETLDKGRWLEGKFVFDSHGTDAGMPVTSRISIGPFTSEGFLFVVSTSADGVSWSEMNRTTYLRLK